MRGKKIFKNEEVHFIKGFANLAKIEVSKYYAEYTIFNNGIFPAPKTKSHMNFSLPDTHCTMLKFPSTQTVHAHLAEIMVVT